jgi:hypothetical protein
MAGRTSRRTAVNLVQLGHGSQAPSPGIRLLTAARAARLRPFPRSIRDHTGELRLTPEQEAVAAADKHGAVLAWTA